TSIAGRAVIECRQQMNAITPFVASLFICAFACNSSPDTPPIRLNADRWMVRRCGMHCCHCIHWDRRRPERLSSGGLRDGGGVHVVLSHSRLDCCIDPTLLGNSTNITALSTLYLHQSRVACWSAMCRTV